MRITTIDELAAYLRTEIVRINAEQAESWRDANGDASRQAREAHLDGQLASVQKTLAMASDDAYADAQRQAASADDRLRPGTTGTAAEGGEDPESPPAGAAVVPEWPGSEGSGDPSRRPPL